MSIDINATPENVWRALTGAGELMRWFPLQARVTPGTGGQTGVRVWLTTHDPQHSDRVRQFGIRAQQLVDRLFR
jgi:uncharacterized protein YndB with AHSA1/START domain